MDTRLDSHKKVLGILYVISGTLTILCMLMLNAFLSIVFSFATDEMDSGDQKAMEMIQPFIQYIAVFVIVLFSVPTLLAGIGLLTRKSWAVLLALIMGCLKLFSFPIGTAMGIYAIWIFSEDQKLKNNPEGK
jgi:hypothetical protein